MQKRDHAGQPQDFSTASLVKFASSYAEGISDESTHAGGSTGQGTRCKGGLGDTDSRPLTGPPLSLS